MADEKSTLEASNPKQFDIDTILQNRERRFLTWNGVDHPIIGVTGRVFLEFTKLQDRLEDAQGDEEAAWQINKDVICLVVPSLSELREEMDLLPFDVLNDMSEFVMKEFTFKAQKGAQENDPEGESPEPETSEK